MPQRFPGWGLSRRAVTRICVPAASALALLTLAVVLRAAPLVRVDAIVSAHAYRTALEYPAWRATMYAVTRTADATSLTPVVVAGVLLLMWRRRWRQAWFVPAAMLTSGALRLLVLNSVDRPRPVDWLAPASGWSFPSGHTTGSAAVAAIVMVVCWPMLNAWWSRTLLVSLAAGWAAAVAASRVALVVHWPSDILGAWLLVTAVVPAVAVLIGALPGVAVTADDARRQRGTM